MATHLRKSKKEKAFAPIEYGGRYPAVSYLWRYGHTFAEKAHRSNAVAAILPFRCDFSAA